MSDRRAMWPIDILLGIFVFIGVSSSVSPWLGDLYAEIAMWLLGASVVAGALWAGFKFFGPDLDLNHDIRESWAQNAAAVAALEAKHAAHPEVAKELSERMLAEKLARLQAEGLLPPVPPPTKG